MALERSLASLTVFEFRFRIIIGALVIYLGPIYTTIFRRLPMDQSAAVGAGGSRLPIESCGAGPRKRTRLACVNIYMCVLIILLEVIYVSSYYY